MSFKLFVAEETASADHALKFLSYKKDQHSIIATRIRDHVIAKWMSIADGIEPAKEDTKEKTTSSNWYKPGPKRVAKKYTTVTVDKSSTISKHGRRFKAGPVVRIGSSYSKEDRDLYKKSLLQSAKALLISLAKKLNDGDESPFHVSQRGHNQFDDIVFEFRTGSINEAIFVVGAERGVTGDFVYFRDYIDRE